MIYKLKIDKVVVDLSNGCHGITHLVVVVFHRGGPGVVL